MSWFWKNLSIKNYISIYQQEPSLKLVLMKISHLKIVAMTQWHSELLKTISLPQVIIIIQMLKTCRKVFFENLQKLKVH